MLLRLLIAALRSPEGKGCDLLAHVCDVYSDFVTFPFGILGQVWFLIVSIPDPCCLSYFIESLHEKLWKVKLFSRPLAPAKAVICFQSEPNIPKRLEYEQTSTPSSTFKQYEKIYYKNAQNRRCTNQYVRKKYELFE